MYNLSFIFDECGFGALPAGIDRERLFNVSYEVGSGDIKLYVLDASERFLYKVSRDGVTRQYAGDDPKHGGDLERLAAFLGESFNEREVVIDAVEDDVYYVYLDDAGIEQTMRVLRGLGRRYGATLESILDTVNAISGRRYVDLEAAAADRAVSLVKVTFAEGQAKLYARPFLRGDGFGLDTETRSFLARLYDCDDDQLDARLTRLWVAKEVASDRVLVVTQHHSLLHAD